MKLVIGGTSQGKKEYVKKNYGEESEVFHELHLRIREWMQAGKDPLREVKTYLREHPEAIIICNEIGCGVVPADAFSREYREKTGRITCYLAEEASEVIRVICGIGIMLKCKE